MGYIDFLATAGTRGHVLKETPSAILDLSIIIASYNTADLTRRCLESIMGQTRGVRYEIVVVDNASTDGSADMIEHEFPGVRLVRNDRNEGFAAAQNLGLSLARGSYLMVLNSDILFVGNSAKELVEFLRAAPTAVGVVGPQVRNADGSIAPSTRRMLMSRRLVRLGIVNRHFHFKRLLPEQFLRRSLGFLLSRWHDNFAANDATREVDLVDGMCVLFRREVFERAGLFDEQFFFDLEINDLSNRVRALGWRIVFYPGVQVVHLAHASRKKVATIVVETHRSELIYYAKYDPGAIPGIKQTVRRVVKLRRLLASVLRGRGGAQTVDLCSRILELVDRFDAEAVFGNERIPRLRAEAGSL